MDTVLTGWETGLNGDEDLGATVHMMNPETYEKEDQSFVQTTAQTGRWKYILSIGTWGEVPDLPDP